jgi:predicted nucleotide-binding protein
MRVLIVEDDHFYSQRIYELLLDQGAQPAIVRTAEDALKADPASFEAAVVDIMLPNDPAATGITSEESRGGFLTGVAVARRLLKKKTALKIVMLSSDIANTEAEEWSSAQSIPFVPKHKGAEALLEALRRMGVISGQRTPLAFIVHGHDSAAVMELKNYIQNILHWQEPIVLRELASFGKTLIEKFEDFARKVDCVFVLLTPDDRAIAHGTNDEKRRSRQNVIFELGFFYAALERASGRVLLLHKGDVELPSDISGIVWVDITNGIAAAGEEIRKELAGLS